MPIGHRNPFVRGLFEDIGRLIHGEAADPLDIEERLVHLARANSPEAALYWDGAGCGHGIPDAAFKAGQTYFFADEPPARIFRTSGTTGAARGTAAYSALGLELMNHSICRNAEAHILQNLYRPAIIRLVPPAAAAPETVMAYGMELIAETYSHPEHSGSVIGPEGIDIARLQSLLDACVAETIPVVLIGGTFAFVNACEALERRGLRWQLPSGSRMIDAGGYKGRSRVVDTGTLRTMVSISFGMAPSRCRNLFGMTELASQLYDAADRPLGPQGERPKGRTRLVTPRVRDPRSMELRSAGIGLLEIVDRCIIDRPHIVLTGDVGIAAEDGVAITGRVERGQARGCSLALEEMRTQAETADA